MRKSGFIAAGFLALACLFTLAMHAISRMPRRTRAPATSSPARPRSGRRCCRFGYWSVLASSAPFGRQAALAIEVSPGNAARLALNAGLNGNRYRCMNAAIGGRTGGFVRVAGRRHEAFSTYAVKDDDPGAVRRVSLDGLLKDDLDAQAPMVIKLDVEGVEIEAIEGAKACLSGNSLLICEDHGSDPTHGVSRHLMKDAALSLYIFDPAAWRFVRIDGPAVLDRVKRYRWVGYNVFGTRSPIWEDRLQSARWICR